MKHSLQCGKFRDVDYVCSVYDYRKNILPALVALKAALLLIHESDSIAWFAISKSTISRWKGEPCVLC